MDKLRDYFSSKMSCQTPWDEHNIICNAKEISTIFVSQENKMDCGLACVRMVLNWTFGCRYEIKCQSFHFPMWTIDMFMVINNASKVSNVQFFTTFCGVGAHHRKLQWYTYAPDVDCTCIEMSNESNIHSSVNEEFDRISELYQYGKDQKWNIIEKLLDTYDIVIALIEKNALVIVLVDSITLKSMKKNKFYNIFTSSWRISGGGSAVNSSNDFAGHYIVIIGKYSIMYQ